MININKIEFKNTTEIYLPNTFSVNFFLFTGRLVRYLSHAFLVKAKGLDKPSTKILTLQ